MTTVAKIEIPQHKNILNPNILNGEAFPDFKGRKLTFASYSEAACALALERFLPDWRCELGETFQVPLVKNTTADFRIRNSIVEYHPFVLQHEFIDRRDGRDILNLLDRLRPSDQAILYNSLSKQFQTMYYNKRRLLMDLSIHKDLELNVVTSFEEFARYVICRNSNVTYNTALSGLNEVYESLPRANRR